MDVKAIYEGSDGEATKQLYRTLEQLGPEGLLAIDLFRAQKCSERAKCYRGGIRGKGSYRSMAYDRKQWSMANLCRSLGQHADKLGITWGWKIDPKQDFHRWVLYVDVPAGQVSFHTSTRGAGPDYAGQWDGRPGTCPEKIIRWVESILTVTHTGGTTR